MSSCNCSHNYTAGQHLEELDFSGRKLTNEQLKYLGGVICLKKLNLRDTQITDAGLEHLRSLPALQILDLSETAITDEGLKIVAAYPRLTNLALQRTRVSDAGVLHLQPLRNLACLDLGNTSITDESLKTVRKFKMLYFLNLAGTQTTDTGLMDLSPLHRLDLLGIANTPGHRPGNYPTQGRVWRPLRYLDEHLWQSDRIYEDALRARPSELTVVRPLQFGTSRRLQLRCPVTAPGRVALPASPFTPSPRRLARPGEWWPRRRRRCRACARRKSLAGPCGPSPFRDDGRRRIGGGLW